MVADSVFLAGPEVAVDVEGDLRRLVTQHRLHLLHAVIRSFCGLRINGRTAKDRNDLASALSTRLPSSRNPCYTLKRNCRSGVPFSS